MSVAVVGDQGAAFACRCLNVRIQTATPTTAPPESVDDPAYTQVYVGEGIETKHTHLTLRSRKRVSTIPGTNRYSRYTTLTCLSCNIPVYRVFQVVSTDIEGKDGPISPSEDYAEKEIMKSLNGWIEVSKGLLTGEAIIKAQSANEYSSVYNVIVPPLSPSRPPAVRSVSQESERSRSPSLETPSYFSHVKAVLPPPPFTPSHPVFLHLAQLAHDESQARRAAAENYVAEIIQQKTAEIEKGDEAIRQQIEAIWRRFRDSIKEAHAQALLAPRSTMRRSSRSGERRSGRSISPASGVAVSVRDFVPVSVPARRTSSPPVRPSALSASLVTTSFHHPRAQRDMSSSQGSDTPDSESSKTLSTASGSSTLVQQPAVDGINILQFRRNINDDINTQASYRFFRIEQEDIARGKRQREEEAIRKAESAQGDKKEAPTSPSGDATAPSTEPTASSSTKPEAQQTNNNDTEQSDSNLPRGRQRKGKRKVTFDVEPDVVTTQKETEPDREDAIEEETEDPREMIFSMEDLEGDEKKTLPAATLPLLEQLTIPRTTRIGRARLQVMPEELASLRPSSLPAPSHIRPIRSQPGVDSSSTSAMMLSLPQYSNPLTRRPPRTNGTKGTLSPAKDSDSQQGSWSADGRSWQSFIRAVAPTTIPEESETETGETGEGEDNVAKQASAPIPQSKSKDDRGASHYNAGIPGSLPIRIHMKTTARQPLSLASYQPQSAIAEQQQQQESEPAVPVNGKHKPSSTAIRKALYAERDRSRSMDPGTMDFTTSDEEDDEEDESSEDEDDRARIEAYLATSRGRRRALKILRARSELPDSGMWRSLAS